MTTATTSENPDTVTEISTLMTSVIVTQNEETSPAAETTTTTTNAVSSSDTVQHEETLETTETTTAATIIETDNTIAEITTAENDNSMSNETGQLPEQFTATENSKTTPSSDTTQNEDTSVSMDTKTSSDTITSQMTTAADITTTENENLMNYDNGQLTTIESSYTSNTSTGVSPNQHEDTSAVVEISALTVSVATETTTITAINASENENSTDKTTVCPLLYENWWGEKCYRLEDTEINIIQIASKVCRNDTDTKNSHLLHGIDMTQEELDEINKRLTQELYWVAVKYDTEDMVWQWRKPGPAGIGLDQQDVLYWLNRNVPLEGVGECGAYNTTSQALQSEDCDTNLPYICQYVNEDD